MLPGLAERIVTMAEKEQIHSHRMDAGYVALRFAGQLIAAVLAIGGLIVGALLIASGHSAAGLAAIFGPLAPIVGAFLYREIRGSDE